MAERKYLQETVRLKRQFGISGIKRIPFQSGQAYNHVCIVWGVKKDLQYEKTIRSFVGCLPGASTDCC
jgi:hypothetical protein